MTHFILKNQFISPGPERRLALHMNSEPCIFKFALDHRFILRKGKIICRIHSGENFPLVQRIKIMRDDDFNLITFQHFKIHVDLRMIFRRPCPDLEEMVMMFVNPPAVIQSHFKEGRNAQEVALSLNFDEYALA